MSERTPVRRGQYVAYFWGGAFLVNAIPHFVTGVCGHAFQSPFASPPGEGLSPAIVNVLWGAFNLVVAWVLLAIVKGFDARDPRHAGVAAAGGLATALMLAHHFAQFHGGR